MSTNAKKRFTALQMLEYPWEKGETARRDKIADSDKKLSMYRVFKSRIEAKVFANIVNWSDDVNTEGMDDVSRRICLIERTFRAFDSGKKGYITTTDLRSLTPIKSQGQNGDDQEELSGHCVYREGDVGNAMYFIISGTIEVSTKDGSHAKRGPGDFLVRAPCFTLKRFDPPPSNASRRSMPWRFLDSTLINTLPPPTLDCF